MEKVNGFWVDLKFTKTLLSPSFQEFSCSEAGCREPCCVGWVISSHSPAAGLCLGPGHHQRSQQMQCFANVGPSCLANKHPELLKQHKPAGTLPPSSSSTKHITTQTLKRRNRAWMKPRQDTLNSLVPVPDFQTIGSAASSVLIMGHPPALHTHLHQSLGLPRLPGFFLYPTETGHQAPHRHKHADVSFP